MVELLIRSALNHRGLVLILALVLGALGLHALRETPVDAIPDLTDTQVIVRASFPGQSPQVVEDQVTYPLSSAMMAVPGAHSVRGFSMYGDAFVYVLFDDGVDPYWARSRVLEYLSQIEAQLPPGVRAELGPDASGVGWIYKYALVDRSGNQDLAQLTALQDWFLKFELQSLPGVAEVARAGGMERQYQVAVDPLALQAYQLDLMQIAARLRRSSSETGGGLIEMGEAEYLVQASGYVRSIEDLEQIAVGRSVDGTPVLLDQVADIRLGPSPRRGIVDLDGQGEVVAGIVVMRSGENAREVIDAVRQRLSELEAALPEGVEVVETYNRAALIERSVATLWEKLALEFLIVVLIIGLFLWQLRSSLVLLISLPLGVLSAVLVMHLQGISANIMSLGGIVISIGVMVDAAIVLIENLQRHQERRPPTSTAEHWRQVTEATLEVGSPIFFSLLIVALSFLPVFALEAQEGRMFSPLAFTKTYAMAAAAGLAVTLVPVLMGYFTRGRKGSEGKLSPVARALESAYRPLIDLACHRPWLVVVLAGLLLGSVFWPLSRLGSEFMPELDEGDLMYMPTTLPGLSPGKAGELLQQTNRLIAQQPEVERVMGKVGRADTATDPAPLTMIESFITLKPKSEWRPGIDTDDIIAKLDRTVRFPGLSNAWVQPIQTRIDMLQTGVRTDVGVEVSGPDLDVIQSLAERIEAELGSLAGTQSVFADRPSAGRYLHIEPDRLALARHDMDLEDLHEIVRIGLGGARVAEAIEGRERYPIQLRLLADWRDSPARLERLPLRTPSGVMTTLGELGRLEIVHGPAMIRSENARPVGLVFVDIQDRALDEWVAEARGHLAAAIELPAGYSLRFTGQYEYLERASERLGLLIPLVLAIIVVLLLMVFRSAFEIALVLTTIPLSLAGGFWLMWWLDYQLSVGVAVGFIALGGLAVETGVIMLVYLNQAFEDYRQSIGGDGLSRAGLRKAVIDGAIRRVRPITMTESTVFLGLAPVMLGSGTGSEVMQRIAAPMVGGVITVWLVALFVMPAIYLIWQSRRLK
ncbi:efflux RND transporter permease subunit [Wenzhouxiangella marina]|uniref:Heavy metal efflux pump, CzcA family n=1 Tax=Wenzhouxiangella marina TaxID=1579979 RepID=A0A0K0XWN9_9GAMM|nr:CusA/CzcA family heavy metal efflux RND transporter [Wenzhouxiangella marina]AKS42047.1 Heavy metal efflux pump, CzcA family [Wenzhouxiangella marina]MBB6086184.1 Cu(I)/Ag(I) efflux system membrane protein CusA/SilA [Wenzhouxiangella marina]